MIKKISVIFIAVMAIHLPAQALDYKIFNGSGCKAVDPTKEILLTRTNSKLTVVAGDQSVDVICPIVKDISDQDTIDYARIHMRSPKANSTCHTRVTRDLGGVASEDVVIGKSNVWQARVLFKVDGGANNSSYMIECTLAPETEVLMYKFGE